MRWVKAFLTGRARQVRWRGVLTDAKPVGIGCPQGTILGPVGWNVLFDPLLRALQACGQDALAYADDLVIWRECDSVEEGRKWVQSGINLTEKWCGSNNMAVSQPKTVATVFSQTAPNQVDLKVCGKTVGCDDNPRFLGIHMGRDLNMQAHLDIVVSRARRRLAAVRRLCAASWRPRTVQIFTFYMALVDSVLFFAGGIWIPLLRSPQLKLLDDLQEEGARLVLGAMGRGISRAALFQEAKLLNAGSRARVLAGLLVCKAKARAKPWDPLCMALAEGIGSWCQVGKDAIAKAKFQRYDVEPDFHAVAADHFYWWHIRERLELNEEEAGPEDLPAIHNSNDYVYYPDGGAQYGVGQTAFTRFRGKRLDAARVWLLDGEEADAFTAEQHGIRGCLKDAAALDNANKVTILSDSLSNISSLISAGPRDRTEHEISELLCKLAEKKSRICLRFTRSHKGTLGNEISDALIHAARAHNPQNVRRRPGRRIAKNICKSRLFESAWGEQRAELRASTVRLKTARHLLECDGELLGSPLLRKQVKSASVTRRDEVVFSQMRLGSAVFSSGFRETDGTRPKCRLCGAEDHPLHRLLECNDAAATKPREQLQAALRGAREDEQKREHERRRWRGLPPRKARVPDGKVRPSDLSKNPELILNFIGTGSYWLDVTAKRVWQGKRKEEGRNAPRTG